MVRRIIWIVLLVAVVAVIGNDAARYVTAQRNLRDTTYDLARWAGENAAGMTREQAGAQLAAQGQARGVTVYQYGQTTEGAQIWAQSTVPGTLIAGTVANLVAGASLSEARTRPFVIRDYREANFL
jgi:hypothetical protein